MLGGIIVSAHVSPAAVIPVISDWKRRRMRTDAHRDEQAERIQLLAQKDRGADDVGCERSLRTIK